jgi:hypothetical protein
MGRYTALDNDIFSVFGSAGWLSENIPTYPDNFVAATGGKYVRICVIPGNSGVNINSLSGVLMVDIFVSVGSVTDTSSIADALDTHLLGRSVTLVSGAVTQFLSSFLGKGSKDSDNPSLFRTTYSIPFNYFGASH